MRCFGWAESRRLKTLVICSRPDGLASLGVATEAAFEICLLRDWICGELLKDSNASGLLQGVVAEVVEGNEADHDGEAVVGMVSWENEAVADSGFAPE